MIVVFATKSFSVTNPGTKPASIGAIVGLPVDCVLIRLGIGTVFIKKKIKKKIRYWCQINNKKGNWA